MKSIFDHLHNYLSLLKMPFLMALFSVKSVSADLHSDRHSLSEALTWSPQTTPQWDHEWLSRVHQDAYYHLVAYSDNGDVVQLHDASKWTVHPGERKTVLGWVQSDDIFIKPYSSCFTSYRYVLYNRSIDTKPNAVKVNMIAPPLPMGEATFRIVNIEPHARLVQLSDNTIWQVDSQSTSFSDWRIGDRLLVGVNNHWRTVPFPQILINADLSKEPSCMAFFYGNVKPNFANNW